MEEKVISILGEVLDCDNIEKIKSSKFIEFDSWDSLKHVMLIIKLEKELEFKLQANEITLIDSYKTLVDVLERKK